MRKKIFLLITCCFLLLLQGCVINKLSANLSVDKNIDNPIIVDFVFVFDDAVNTELEKTPSAQWYAKRDQYMLDWGTSKKIQVLSYELVAGQHIQIKHFKPFAKPLELIIYASYLTQGDHRVIIKDYSYMDLFLNKDDLLIKINNL